nr:MAG TPA: hypothetical protein [Caudoviricetes sp.]
MLCSNNPNLFNIELYILMYFFEKEDKICIFGIEKIYFL